MLRLILWDDADEQFEIDLYDNEPVNLNYQFTDISEINKTLGSYSQTFRIPATKLNKDFFGAIYDPNIYTDSSGLINGKYDVKKKIRAELVYQSVPMMRGYVQLKQVFVQKKDFADIELAFFGETVDLKSDIGDAMISDLNTSAINHTLTYLNVIVSWLQLLVNGNVVYGMMDKGRNWSFADASNPAWSSTNGVWQGDMTPYVRVKWLVDNIFSEAGFTYDSDFLDSALVDDMYLPAYNGAISPVSDDTDPEQQLCGAGLTAFFTLTTAYQTVPLIDTATGGYDYNANWDNVAYDYTAPYSGYYTFTFNLYATNVLNLDAQILHNTTAIHTLTKNKQFEFSVFMLAGDTIKVQAKKTSAGANQLRSGTVGDGMATWLRCTEVSEALMGQDVDVAANLPEMKQIDFLLGLQKMFNLVFVPDKNKPKHLIIEPFKDYVSTGTAKDWTNKIDFTKDVVVKPTTDIQAKQYDWTHVAGQDFINTFIQESTGRVYGRHRVTDPENDFATGDKKIESGFVPYLMSNIPASPFEIHRCIDKDGNGVQKPKPRISFYNGYTLQYGTWYFRTDTGATALATTFPQFSSYGSVNPTIGDEDLNFGYERAFIWMEAHPLHTLFYDYWTDYVNELYSNEARILTAYVKLTRADIKAFEYSDKIYIKDAYYRILKISNFDATQGGSVQVEFIKVLEDIPDCGKTPNVLNSDGTIRFGLPGDYGTKHCCERYGYVWRPRIGRCYPRPPLTQPT